MKDITTHLISQEILAGSDLPLTHSSLLLSAVNQDLHDITTKEMSASSILSPPSKQKPSISLIVQHKAAMETSYI